VNTTSTYSPDSAVPAECRVLGGRDFFSLWFSLSVGLMVVQTGALLAPGLGLAQSWLAIACGSLVGSLLLATAATIGTRTGLSAMSALKLNLGRYGVVLPAILNILQLLGWGSFELIVMRDAAVLLSNRFLGEGNALASPVFWTLAFGLLVTVLAVAGPLTFVRRILRRWGIWLLLGACLWLTWNFFAKADLAELWTRPGDGSLDFATGFDIAIAMPLSWLPLIADYARFGHKRVSVFGGTAIGYCLGNAWLMGLGVAYTLAFAEAGQTHALLLALAGAGVGIPLLLILLDESENAFAAIHSAAVSSGILIRLKVEHLALMFGALCTMIAWQVELAEYEHFLLLIGSVFAPLFGVVLVDHFVLHKDRIDRVDALRWDTLVAWVVGIAAYHILAHAWPILGATLPALVLAGLLQLILGKAAR
jgi:putative hydroxymethylpyrimidine transporter CytX